MKKTYKISVVVTITSNDSSKLLDDLSEFQQSLSSIIKIVDVQTSQPEKDSMFIARLKIISEVSDMESLLDFANNIDDAIMVIDNVIFEELEII